METLEKYFEKFRRNILGIDAVYHSPYGEKKIVYCDWIASGRLYRPIEETILESFGPFVANTHTEASELGTRMTKSYHLAHKIIKGHVNAGPNDVIITSGSGMTSVVNKLIRILGLRGNRNRDNESLFDDPDKPVVFVTHMEHHSNHTSWYETQAEVVVLQPGKDLLIDLDELRRQLERYRNHTFKIGAFTAGSNVTGILTPVHEMARIMHEYGGIIFVDYAAAAPYVDINMHPGDPLEKLDGIYFSPHKFLGGPGSSGILIFDKSVYKSKVPDNPGGGTVCWTNPWGDYKYIDDIETREDGGTPGFLQAIRAALAIRLKEEMGTEKIRQREKQLVRLAFSGLDSIPSIKILAGRHRERLGVISFYHPEIHYNLIVKTLSDRYGIQARGGCVCAGTYGHFLLEVSYDKSREIIERINSGDLSTKPGWVRWSLHPTTTDDEVRYFVQSLSEIIQKYDEIREEYRYDNHSNEFIHKTGCDQDYLKNWFSLG